MPAVMYAVIATGGKQEKVEEGQVLEVEVLKGAETGSTVDFTPILVVGEKGVTSAANDLAKAKVSATVIGPAKAKKINGFLYKNKSNNRKRWGHRQKLTQIKIDSIKG